MTLPDDGTLTEIAAAIQRLRHPLLLSHAKPDGDALGSLVAMRSFLGQLGVEARALLFDPLPSRYAVFNRYESMPVWKSTVEEADLADVDGVIVLDTCTYNQLSPIADWLRTATVPKIAVDHHVTRDDLADHYVVDESAAATCLILYEWAQAMGWSIEKDTGEALLIGMAMDTGWFRHANTDARVLSACADLAQRGVRSHELHQELFLRESPGRVRLLGVALGAMQLHARQRMAVMALTSEAITRVGATKADTEDIVNEPLRIGSVVVSILLVEDTDGPVRVSFRSKPPLVGGDDDADVDVAALAAAFGGGGHTRAAGARIDGKLSEVQRSIVERVSAALGT